MRNQKKKNKQKVYESMNNEEEQQMPQRRSQRKSKGRNSKLQADDDFPLRNAVEAGKNMGPSSFMHFFRFQWD
jgi:hypothetical protein